MKKYLSSLLFLFCCLFVSAQTGGYMLTVQTRSDLGRHLFYADEIDHIDFTATAMTVHPKAGGAQQFEKSDVRQMTFRADSHESVDLGLSVRWATCNLGAAAPQDYGRLYAWGETTSKSDYAENRYKYYAKDQYQYIGTNICGTDYDTARQQWGGKWRLPTRAEVAELTARCTWTAEVLEGVAGYRVTGPSGGSIFLPSAGCQTGTARQEEGTGGYYWTGTLNVATPSAAYNLNFRGYDAEWSASRAYGFSIRPVR